MYWGVLLNMNRYVESTDFLQNKFHLLVLFEYLLFIHSKMFKFFNSNILFLMYYQITLSKMINYVQAFITIPSTKEFVNSIWIIMN